MTVVEVRGEWDLSRAGELRDRLVAAGAAGDGEVVVDVSGVTFVDSTCLGVLVAAHKRLAAEGRDLVVRGADAGLAGVLQITRLDRFLNLQP